MSINEAPEQPEKVGTGPTRRLVLAVGGGMGLAAVLASCGVRGLSAVPATPGPRTVVLDYQTGDFSQYERLDENRPEQTKIVTSPARHGYPYSAQYITAPGDHTFGILDTDRAEARVSNADTDVPAGCTSEQWYAWSTYYPSGTQPASGQFFYTTQWHHLASSGVPNVAFGISDSNPPLLKLAIRGQGLDPVTEAPAWQQFWYFDAVPYDTWLDYLVYIKWSSDPAVGRIGVTVNGTVLLPVTTPCANLYAGLGSAMKQGLYRGASATLTHTVYHTGTVRGDHAAAVALRS